MHAKWTVPLLVALTALACSESGRPGSVAPSSPARVSAESAPAFELGARGKRRLGPGRFPALVVSVRNPTDHAITVSAEEGADYRLCSLVHLGGGGAAHRPVAMEPAEIEVPPGETRVVAVRDPGENGDHHVRWAAGRFAVQVDYSSPAAPRSCDGHTERYAWEVVDDGSATELEGRLEQIRLTVDRAFDGRFEVRAENRELRSLTIPRSLSVAWMSGVETIDTQIRELPPQPRLRPNEDRVLARLDLEPPPTSGRLLLEVGFRRGDEERLAARAVTSVRRPPR